MLEMQDAYMDVGGRQCLEQIVEQFPAQVKKLFYRFGFLVLLRSPG
jgi:hypothetical protein